MANVFGIKKDQGRYLKGIRGENNKMKLTSLDQVEKSVGKSPAPRDLKVIDHIDEHAARWLSYSNVGFIAFGSIGKLKLTALAGEKGVVSPTDAVTLTFPISALDDHDGLVEGTSFGALFMVGAMEETLRVNGKVGQIEDDIVSLKVQECYLHCAKSFKRSAFWESNPNINTPDNFDDFIQQTRFMAVATINSQAEIDVSPKGDPAGFLLQQESGFLCYADRPGNRRIDSFRNIIEEPDICILAMIPGSTALLHIQGKAALHTDKPLLEKFEVQGKCPNLVIKVEDSVNHIKESCALSRARLWPVGEKPEDIKPSQIFKDHVKHSKVNSLQAKMARAAVTLPGAMEKGLEIDYKKNMY